MPDGTDGTIIILDWCNAHSETRRNARTHAHAHVHVQGRRRISRDSQTVRIGGQIIIRSHNRACPFLLLAFSQPPLFFHAPWEFPPCTFDLSQPFSLSVCKRLHGTPTWTRLQDLRPPSSLLASFPFSLRVVLSETPWWSCVYKDRLFRLFSRRRFDLSLSFSLDRFTWIELWRGKRRGYSHFWNCSIKSFSTWISMGSFFKIETDENTFVDRGVKTNESINQDGLLVRITTFEEIVFLAGTIWADVEDVATPRRDRAGDYVLFIFFLRGCDWTLPKSFVPTPCRHTRSDRGTASYLSPSTARNHRGEYTSQCSFDPYCWTAVDVHHSRTFNYPLSTIEKPFSSVQKDESSFVKISSLRGNIILKILFLNIIFDSCPTVCQKSLFRLFQRRIFSKTNFEKEDWEKIRGKNIVIPFVGRIDIDKIFVEEYYFRFGKKILEDILTKKARNGHRREGERGLRHATARERMRRDLVRTRPLDKCAKGAAKRAWNEVDETAKERKRSAKNGEGGDREERASRDLGIPNPHLIRFPPNNPLFLA